MHPFRLGSTLLHKYRVVRFRKRKDGVLLYEGVDTLRPRRVCIHLLDRAALVDDVKCARFHDEAHAANVIDIGTCDGVPYFVTAELTAPQQPRPSKKPPPLPTPRDYMRAWAFFLVAIAATAGIAGWYVGHALRPIESPTTDPLAH
ncbi:MAG TPA: hypothetical protein VGH87_10285 [Polyangiaceae bacterium]|nr:hypothetical protein [Polyangiaceae bacterium]